MVSSRCNLKPTVLLNGLLILYAYSSSSSCGSGGGEVQTALFKDPVCTVQ